MGIDHCELTEAWKEAQKEGLTYFRAQMHVGHVISFVGRSWEDGGFFTDESGDPLRDFKGNSVASFKTEALDSTNDAHVHQVSEWYG